MGLATYSYTSKVCASQYNSYMLDRHKHKHPRRHRLRHRQPVVLVPDTSHVSERLTSLTACRGLMPWTLSRIACSDI
jgi:hypothetical protein